MPDTRTHPRLALVDIDALADRVYRLWLADLRLEGMRAPDRTRP